MPRTEFIDRIELLARGRFTTERTLISENFASGLYLMLTSKGCTIKEEKDYGAIIMEQLRKKLASNSINLEYFN